MNYKDKEKVLQEHGSCKLWEERLYINEDFSEETMREGRNSLNKQKVLWKKGKFAKVIHNRLISFDPRQNPSEFDASNEEQEAS